ncbi:TIGR04325 family methyltransferase [Luteibacter aegosomatissinici]|uniref:TIGR04325 family methyltransferase n=1 Tax=Luteibacter aegosomatissinici TaxID=2911539 RepID=UPI001FF8368F|nr:TIGR04325 family methyltransferase [Luteibacter aegosomatissinici]UPG94296.1 TIGR04325 family methyltransferase [Luteibacter aegosomatissinici]
MADLQATPIWQGKPSRIPFVRRWQDAWYERRFLAHVAPTHHIYRGVYASFDEAKASIPAGRTAGYDNAGAADMYRDRTRRVFINDYPMIYWLERFFGQGARSVFDLGGHIGIAYYAYQRYLEYPDGVAWTVQDVPAVNAAGRAWADTHDARRTLAFVPSISEALGADILFAAGSLQYLEYTLVDAVEALPRRPRFLLLNSVPVHGTTTYFTVQNMGVTCCPYRVTSERDFLGSLTDAGYTLLDRWENPHRHCTVPFHPELSLDRYFGFAFARGAGA